MFRCLRCYQITGMMLTITFLGIPYWFDSNLQLFNNLHPKNSVGFDLGDSAREMHNKFIYTIGKSSPKH